MVQRTFRLNSMDELPQVADRIRSEQVYRTSAERVLLAWAQLWDPKEFAFFGESIRKYFPDCTTVGTNHYSDTDILNGRTDGKSEDRGVLLSFLLFEAAGVSLFHTQTGIMKELETGAQLNRYLRTIPELKGVYLVTPEYFCSMEALVRPAFEGLEEVPVFGIKTSLLPEYQTFGYEKGGSLICRQLFAVVFFGEGLSIRLHYNLGWNPIGRVMTVTKEENPFFVDEIDGKAATNIYNKYLGLRNDQIIPENLSEFPLILFRDGIRISRIGISGPKEGQLVFGAPVYQDDKISLSYGNSDDLFSEIRQDSDEIGAFEPQAGLLIVCANRVMFLRDREKEEIDYFRRYMKEAAVVYGYAEIFYLKGKGGELNSALVSVAFKEEGSSEGAMGGGRSEKGTDIPMQPVYHKTVLLTDRLARFFKEMSNDLLAAVKEAEDANRIKSAFFACISHEFRTPLNSVLGMNEMILKESRDENITEYAKNIDGAGKILLQLVNDILDTEKIEAGKMEIIPVEYEPRRLIRELLQLISFLADKKGLKLKQEISEDLPPVLFGDENRIRQCVLNLLNNAVKYTEQGEVLLKVTAEPVEEKRILLRFSVRDTGIGIRPEDIQKLNTPFSRVDQARNRNIEGSGLGLTVVRSLLALMGSSLEIQSTYGEGSVFSFGILQEVREKKAGAVPPLAENPEKTAFFKKEGEQMASILIVDDTPMNIDVMKVFLKNSGLDIDSASGGRKALDMVREKQYDMIFLDHQMPEMDGTETFHRMREDKGSKCASAVFVMLTASEKEGDKDRFLSDGFDDFMSKPVRKAELEAIIKKYLAG